MAGRPSNSDSSATYDLILTQARALLKGEGMEAVTVRKVAGLAGVGSGTLRYYFATHEELLEACLDSYHEGLRELQTKLSTELLSATSPRAAIRFCIESIFDYLEENAECARMRSILTTRKGGVPTSRHAHFRGPFLDGAAMVLSKVSNKPLRDMRLVADAANRLISSYAIASDAEACHVTGLPDVADARKELRTYSVKLCCQLVFDSVES